MNPAPATSFACAQIPKYTADTTMVKGMSNWFSRGVNDPGVYAVPRHVKKVPKLSKIPMIKNGFFGNLRISDVTWPVRNILG
mmetsp:Transcript_4363/g.14027  ORF Transcript_4363/g.14027 Transcript_4363/m.14027 type:complete len:82 (+) Transcript_4363:987-1232(+)